MLHQEEDVVDSAVDLEVKAVEAVDAVVAVGEDVDAVVAVEPRKVTRNGFLSPSWAAL